MYGVNTTSQALQRFAASRLRQVLQSLTKLSFVAVFFGIVMTVAFQSSAATTVLVVEFVNAGMMSLGQALGIVLGTAVGTSISIQLIAFQILDIALGAIFAGFMLTIFGSHRWKDLGHALIGFGLIFVGMSNMSSASAPLRNVPEVLAFLSHLGSKPVLAILVGIIFTALIQSSTAVFAVMMSLAGQHLMGLDSVIPLVLGAHTGGTITTLLSSFTAKKMDAKRTAIANTAYKVVATVLVYPFMPQFAKLVEWTTNDLQRQVANAHLLFAVLMVVIFFPFNDLIAKGLQRLIPERKDYLKGPRFKYIDESSLEVPAVALNQAWDEIIGLGEFIRDQMMQKIPAAVMSSTDRQAEEIRQAEVSVDWYYRHMGRFLSALAKRNITEEQTEDSINAQFILKELEYMGDVVAAIAKLMIKVHRESLSLSPLHWEFVQSLYEHILENYVTVLKALRYWDSELAATVIRRHPEIIRLQRSLQFDAMAPAGELEASKADTRSGEKLRVAVMDLISLLYSIDEHTVNIAQVVMGIV